MLDFRPWPENSDSIHLSSLGLWSIDLDGVYKRKGIGQQNASYPFSLGFRTGYLPHSSNCVPMEVMPCEPVRLDAYTGKPMTFFRDPDGLPIEIHE